MILSSYYIANMQSISLTLELLGQSLHSLVELSRVLRHTVLHFVLNVKGSNQIIVFSRSHTSTTMLLSQY